jgi:hypothetical protein
MVITYKYCNSTCCSIEFIPILYSPFWFHRFEEDATVEWVDLGTFCAEDERRAQQFPLETHVYAKYIKVRVVNLADTLYGNDRQISRLDIYRIAGNFGKFYELAIHCYPLLLAKFKFDDLNA